MLNTQRREQAYSKEKLKNNIKLIKVIWKNLGFRNGAREWESKILLRFSHYGEWSKCYYFQ